MIQWSQDKMRGSFGRYEVIIVPDGPFYTAHILVAKTRIKSITECSTIENAQEDSEKSIDVLSREAQRWVERVDEPDDMEMEDE